jgi:hypothetical protein
MRDSYKSFSGRIVLPTSLPTDVSCCVRYRVEEKRESPSPQAGRKHPGASQLPTSLGRRRSSCRRALQFRVTGGERALALSLGACGDLLGSASALARRALKRGVFLNGSKSGSKRNSAAVK